MLSKKVPKLAPDAKIECPTHKWWHRNDERCRMCPPSRRRFSEDPANWGPGMFTTEQLENLTDDDIRDLINAYIDPAWNPTFDEKVEHGSFVCYIYVDDCEGTEHFVPTPDGRRIYDWNSSARSFKASRKWLVKDMLTYRQPRKV